MLKNVGHEENIDNNNENVDDSLSDDENEMGPIINLKISLNNGKKASLEIYERDNIEEKVKRFCITNKICPNDEQKLLQRVKEELETKSNDSQNDAIQYIQNSKNEKIKESNNMQEKNPRNIDFIPENKNKLDHILNESESFSKSESFQQSNNILNNLIKDFKSDDINKIT